MIRIFIYLLTLTFAQAESLTRAYLIGKGQVSLWKATEEQLLNRESDGSPNKKTISLPEPSPLKTAPFKSIHFHKGDLLYDFKIFKEYLADNLGKQEHVIYNETTGRLVIQGEDISHYFFKSITEAATKLLPKTIELQLEVREGNQSLIKTSLQSKPGEKLVIETGSSPNQLKIDWEANVGFHEPYVEARLALDGTVRNQPFEYANLLTTINDITLNTELGSPQTDLLPLSLHLTHRVLLPGGISTSEIVLDEDGIPITSSPASLMDSLLFEESPPDPKTGKILLGFPVSPLFHQFLKLPSSGDESDPFASNDQDTNETDGFIYLKRWDPRIPSAPGDRIADCKQLLEDSGVLFDDSDFAALSLETYTLFVLASRESLEFVELIIHAGCSHPPRLIKANLQLIETSEKPTLESLKNKHSVLAQASIITLPGDASTLALGPMHFDLEARFGANDSLIETRLAFQLAEEDEEPSFSLKTGLFFETGIPQIIQSTFNEGKWQSVIATFTIQSPWERASLDK